ncbi:MAG: hypothetical protein H7096_12775 [Flavobacterium sp.]|nr:hypothetical protein [Pedobacter sp.]
MKKYSFLALIIVCLCSNGTLHAQQLKVSSISNAGKKFPAGESARAQNVFVEILGQGLLFTANYDTRFGNRRDGLGGRIGIGYVAADNDNATTIPVSLNYLLGNGGKHFFEIGLGATVIASKTTGSFFFEDNQGINKNSNVIGTMSFSYRLQPVNNGFSLRAGITPIFNGDFFLPYFGGLSLGYTF